MGQEGGPAANEASNEVTLDTVVQRPRKGDQTKSTAQATTHQPSTDAGPSLIASPLDALRQDELYRSRRMGATGALIGLAVAVAAIFLTDDRSSLTLIWSACVVGIGGNLYLAWIAVRPHRYTPGRVGVVWVVTSIGVSFGVAFFGVFSPAPIAPLLGVYFVGLGSGKKTAVATYASSALMQASFSVLIAFDVISDPGLITAEHLGTAGKLILQALVQIIFLLAFVLARWSQRITANAVIQLDGAARSIAKREALYEEARQDLEHVLRVGGPGRFSGEQFGSYLLGDLIGRGGIGEVYDATDAATGARAAIKLLRVDGHGGVDKLERFRREARAISRLDTPHVVRVLEVYDESDPLPYIAMERLDGEDLGEILRRRRQLDGAATLELVRQLGAGLAAAADAGVIHRDIKPQNVFRTRSADGGAVWKLVDFGVSKLGDDDRSLTRGQLVGTPSYMAPEQARGGDLDHRADLYALAALTYRALTGVRPFRGHDVASVLYEVAHGMPPRPSKLANLPKEVDLVLAVGLAKRPWDRFETARQLGDALADALEGRASSNLREHAERLSPGWK